MSGLPSSRRDRVLAYVRRGLVVPLAAALVLTSGACVARDTTPVVVRGQLRYSAPDGGGPYTFAALYLRAEGGVRLTDQVVGEDGRFTLRLENEGDARRHGRPVRFNLLFDTTWFSTSCESILLPLLRLGERNGERVWLSASSGKPLPPVTILIHMDGDDLFRIDSGKASTPRTRRCPA